MFDLDIHQHHISSTLSAIYRGRKLLGHIIRYERNGIVYRAKPHDRDRKIEEFTSELAAELYLCRES